MLFLTVIPLKEMYCYSETKLTDSAFILVKICTRLLFLFDTQKCIVMLKGERIILSCSFIPLRRLIFILFVIVHLWTLIYFLIHGNNIFIAEYNSHVINSISFFGVFFCNHVFEVPYMDLPWKLGFPCGSAGKESACNAGDLGSIPGLGWSPGEGKGYPLQCSGLENSMYCTDHGVAKSQTWLSNFHCMAYLI